MDPGNTFRNRSDSMRWLRQSGAVILFKALDGDGFSAAFGKALELSPAEMGYLNEVVLGTKNEIEAARLSRSTSRSSEDGKTLIVDIPAVDVASSRAAYDRLLDSLKSTLGPARYEVFNELGGEGFERSFDQFGLNDVRYELVLQPTFPFANAGPHYEYKRHFLDATGTGKGWSGSTVSINQMEKHDPILARFLRSKLSATDKR